MKAQGEVAVMVERLKRMQGEEEGKKNQADEKEGGKQEYAGFFFKIRISKSARVPFNRGENDNCGEPGRASGWGESGS